MPAKAGVQMNKNETIVPSLCLCSERLVMSAVEWLPSRSGRHGTEAVPYKNPGFEEGFIYSKPRQRLFIAARQRRYLPNAQFGKRHSSHEAQNPPWPMAAIFSRVTVSPASSRGTTRSKMLAR